MVYLFLLLWLISNGQCAKILGVFHAPARSHFNLGSALMRRIAESGHDATIISCFNDDNLPKNGNYRQIVLNGSYETFREKFGTGNQFEMEDVNSFMNVLFLNNFGNFLTELVLQHQNFQDLIKSNEKFDVVIVEQFVNDAQKALAKHFNAHLIVLSTVGANFWINPLVGNPAPTSYIPCILLDYSSNMNILERLHNSLVVLFNKIVHNYSTWPKQDALIKKYISPNIDLEDVLYNASIILLNSHPSINQPVPYVPNMIDIGGFHVQTSKQLPKDLQDFLDDAPDGVIYFSMGSNLKSTNLPQPKRDAIISVFRRLKQKILFKWEDDNLENKPSNVKIMQWIPQQEVLAHSNIRLFITHGGFLSTTETIYHGVPILAIPIFGDQKMNARLAINGGFGLMVPYRELHEEKLESTIRELLDNPKYRKNAKLRSKLFHDRPNKPLQTAIYWIEFVIRNNGAQHLRVTGLDLPWYKYYLIDIVVLTTTVILSVILGFVILLRVYYTVRKEKKLKKK